MRGVHSFHLLNNLVVDIAQLAPTSSVRAPNVCTNSLVPAWSVLMCYDIESPNHEVVHLTCSRIFFAFVQKNYQRQ